MHYVDGPPRSRTTPHGRGVRDCGTPALGARGLLPCEADAQRQHAHHRRLAHKDTALAYLQLVLRRAAEEFRPCSPSDASSLGMDNGPIAVVGESLDGPFFCRSCPSANL